MSYVTGNTIKELREKKQLTQKQLSDILKVSDKTISKWETGRGLPDVGIITELASVLGVSLAELLNGQCINNSNRSANMMKTSFYVCPVCGNVIHAIGIGSYSCCGIQLPKLEVEESDNEHEILLSDIDGEIHVSMQHVMSKEYFISFYAYVTSDDIQMVKLYPEQSAEARFAKRGRGYLYAYCTRHGLYKIAV